MSWWWEFAVGLGTLASCIGFRRLRGSLGWWVQPLLCRGRTQLSCSAPMGGNGDDMSVRGQSELKSFMHGRNIHGFPFQALLNANTMDMCCWGRLWHTQRGLLLCSGASTCPLEKQTHPMENQPSGALLHAPACLPRFWEKELFPLCVCSSCCRTTPLSGYCITFLKKIWHFLGSISSRSSGAGPREGHTRMAGAPGMAGDGGSTEAVAQSWAGGHTWVLASSLQ